MKSVVELNFPAGGLNRRYGYQKQPPYTTPDCLNVRSESTLDGRERGGSRPGLTKAFTTQLGSGNPIRLINQVREVFSINGIATQDDFDGTALASIWTAMPWAEGNINPAINDATGDLPGVSGGAAVSILAGSSSNPEVQAAVRDLVNLDDTLSYSVSVLTVPKSNGRQEGEYFIFVRMDDSSPNIQTDGAYVHCICQHSGAQINVSGSLYVIVSGVATEYIFNATNVTFGPFLIVLSVSPSDVITLTIGGTQAISQSIASLSLPSGRRIGFGLRDGSLASGFTEQRAIIEYFSLNYFPASGNNMELNRVRAMASSNGTLYREGAAMAFESVTDVDSLNLASDRMIQSDERLGSLFIADNGIRDSGADGTISGQGGSSGAYTCTFDDGGGQDWDDVCDVGDIVWIYSASNAANMRFARVTAINGGGTTISLRSTELSSGLGAFVNEAGTVAYRVLRSLKVYSSSANTLRAWLATDGEAPYGCALVCKYLDRMVLANAVDAPHAWFMSRQGDPYDFDYGAASTDLQRAVASINADAGSFGEPITALIPYHDDYLIFGCRSTLWILRGDPAQGGRIDNMSRITGCLTATSWCYAPGGELFILGSDGIYVYQVGTGGFSESTRRGSFSRDRIPDELKNLNPNNYYVTMGYDVDARGIHVFVTPVAATEGQRHWWIDLETSGFFPMTLPTTMEATAATYYTADDPSSNAMLLGGRDGYVRKFSTDALTDDGTAFIDDSYVTIGPIACGTPAGFGDGMLDEIVAAPALDSGDVDWELYVGNTAEAAFNSTAAASGTFTAGLNHTARPRRRGAAAYVKIKGDTDPWAIEQLAVMRTQLGRLRVG